MDYSQFQDLFMEHWLEGAKALGAYVFGLFTWLLARVFKSNQEAKGRAVFEATLQALKNPTGCTLATPRIVHFEGGSVGPDNTWESMVLLRLSPKGTHERASHLFTKKELKIIYKASLEAIKQWQIEQKNIQERNAVRHLQGFKNDNVKGEPFHGPAVVMTSMVENGEAPMQGVSKR